MAALIPQKVGHYDVLGELGRGGMGIVYRVQDQRNGQLAAMKIVPPDALGRPEAALRFKREFRAMQRVRHPNVIRVFEAGTHEGCPFFTMELIEGKVIHGWLDGDQPIVKLGGKPPPTGALSPEQRARLNEPRRVRRLVDAMVQVGFAIGAIHSHRIVHRDLKPDNILVSNAGVVKLMDFGIAKQLTANSEHSSGGMMIGTFKYLSPEQALGVDVDARADLYSLGIVLYELLAGRHPFYADHSVGYAFQHARQPPPPITRFNPEVNETLAAVCERLIQKDPNDRYPSAEDLIAALRGTHDGKPAPSVLPRKAGPPSVDGGAQLFAPAMTGRERQLTALVSLCEDAKRGRGQVALIRGPQGIGKSRLLRELAGRTRELAVDILIGRAPQESCAAYQPYLDVLGKLVDEVVGSPKGDLRRLFGKDGPALARYLPTVEQHLRGALPPQQPLAPESERARFLAAVISFLGKMSAVRPRVIIIDDLQYADELSLELTRHLLQALTEAGPEHESARHRLLPFSLVLTVDTEGVVNRNLQRLLSGMRAAGGVRTFDLAPLGPAQVRDMVATMIGGGDVAEVLGEALHQDTGGIPGRVEARVRAWAESGELRKVGREWVVAPSKHQVPTDGAPPVAPRASRVPEGSSSPPGSTGEVVELRAVTRADIAALHTSARPSERRVEKLSPVARDVGVRAAVVGEHVSARLLSRIALRTEDELLDAVDELLKSSIWVEELDGEEYRFGNRDDRDALLRTLSTDRREQMHALIARALADEARRTRRRANPDLLARHHLEAKQPLRALEYLMQAARVALQENATQTAAERVREAQALFLQETQGLSAHGGHLRRDGELVLLRLDVLAAIGEHREAMNLARRRVPQFQGKVDLPLLGELYLRWAVSERMLGEHAAALEHLGEVLRLTERVRAPALRCRAKRLCGQIYEQRGQFDRSHHFLAEALDLARAIGDQQEEENARRELASRSLETGDLLRAEEEFQRLLQNAENRGEYARISFYLNALGLIAHERGATDEAERAYRQVIEKAKPAGDRRSVAIALGHIGLLRRDQGRLDDAHHLVHKAQRIFRDLEAVDLLSAFYSVQSELYLLGGKTDEALQAAREAVAAAERAGLEVRRAEGRIRLGAALARQGAHDEGRHEIAAGLDAARRYDSNRLILAGLEALTRLEGASGRDAFVQSLVREGLTRAQRSGFVRFIAYFENAFTGG